MVVTSCTKENLSRLQDVVNTGDDHGGASGGGSGEHISASSVPDTVTNAFNEKFSGAVVSEWKKLDNGNYKVEFTLNGENWEAIFSAIGELVKQEND